MENKLSAYNFAVIGAAGYVAPKHFKAIKDTGNRLIAALDKSDSVGTLDSYSYDTAFFTEFERFDRHAEKLKRLGDDKRIHYVSICSPNYLHDAHIRFALRIGANAICEKPLVLNPWNLDALAEIEKESGMRIYNILQLRVHPSIMALKKQIQEENKKEKYQIDLSYITSRGNWYFTSWKGSPDKSGGIATNIGIHFFDMLIWLFGDVKYSELHLSDAKKMGGFIELEKAKVRWFLSVDRNDLPAEALAEGKPTFRSITIDENEIEFSGGFTDLHTMVYQDILDGNGFGIEDARPSLNLVSELRDKNPVKSSTQHIHPMVLRQNI
ncbi:MAG: Gfo/Idh/MocA family oxidoreductase [Proteobacteria bacterium]|nr:Gfo/Idh/MocA family oxidoreductase [Pseudomonadota bacterium]MBU1582683.1 Gfo/Idh/MocA family oxidoreductase [Pseudomonadota bacterium]MBU2451690.1 Gfo/Idh/MocA family oxidoreductase [Pseudomonadota bacterium]MBU2631221.1 Gfo/Idh/MocA family oxidoreductase [Pseudomonadota bacterium]